MSKDLIIGGFTNYIYDQIKPWAESIDECRFQGDKVLVVGDASVETIRELQKKNFMFVPMQSTNITIHVSRFLYIYEYLRLNWEEYDNVIVTDVVDVYFQNNPSEWLKKHNKDFKIIVGSESIQYKHESWGNLNLLQCYGPYIHDIFKNNIIYNVGVIAGKSEYIKDLVFNIFINSINRPIQIVDQAVFNIIINTQPYKDCVYFAQQSDGWVCHAGTTSDPNMMMEYRPLLTESEPYFKDGVFYSSNHEPFCIVHQYNRVPEWNDFIINKYKQK